MNRSAAAGLDESPAAILYERHALPMLAYLRLHAPTWEDAEDILQEVFLAAMDQGRLLHLPEGEQLAWLGGIARHKLADHYRRLKRRPALPLETSAAALAGPEALAPEAVIVGQEAQRELWAAVRQLSALQQQVIYLRFVGGLRSQQIASLLGKQEVAVRKLLSRAMNQLRGLYQPAEKG
ncbi:MAG TPA: sigma-70 family RNA polymerase sigma factor [Ktedonobacterales bacterium]